MRIYKEDNSIRGFPHQGEFSMHPLYNKGRISGRRCRESLVKAGNHDNQK